MTVLSGDWASLLRRTALLLLATAVLALLGNWIRPEGISWSRTAYQEIAFPEMVAGIQSGRALAIDARTQEEFDLGHLAGSMNFPSETQTQHPDWIHTKLPSDQNFILYCRGADCPGSRELAEYLVQHGVAANRVFVFTPGWDFLKGQTRLPLSTGDKP